MKKILLSTAALAMVCGCTTLHVNKFKGDSPASRKGIAYYLPFTQFQTKITWSASCDKDTHEFALTPKIEATPKTGPDPAGIYVIDYESLSAFTKTSSVKVDFYDSGAIKSINAAADDRTGEILSKTISAAGKVAKLVAFGGAATAHCSDDPTDGLIAALQAVTDQKKIVEGKTKTLTQATDTLTAFAARLAREGASITDEMRGQHSKLVGEVVGAQIELDSEKSKLEEMQKAVSSTTETAFPATSNEFANQTGFRVPVAALKKWVRRETGEAKTDPGGDVKYENRLKDIAEQYSMWIDLTIPSSFNDKKGEDSGRSEDGVRYRIGVPGQLRMCKGGPCDLDKIVPKPVPQPTPTPTATPTGTATPDIGNAVRMLKEGELVKALPVTVLQQNTTFFLPFSSKAFTNGALTATFSEGGVLTSAGYEQKKAPGEVLAGLADSLADQVTAVAEEARKNDKTDLQKVEEQTKLAEAQKKLKDAQAALVDTEPEPGQADIAALAADTAVKQAELANVTADIALRDARKKLDEAGGP